MSRAHPQLPAEVWIHIFRFLSVSDKFRLRETCKSFKTLVDHASLWRGWTVVLGFRRGSYNSEFWSSLRRRRVLSVVVRSGKVKDWERLSRCLPGLSTLVLDLSSQTSLSHLSVFPQLRRLAVRNRDCSHLVLSGFLPACRAELLTHLSLCGVTFPNTSMDTVVSALSQFTSLTSLICHRMLVNGETFCMIHSLIAHLPRLKHLSLSVWPGFRNLRFDSMSGPHLSEWTRGQTTAADLSSLELIDCWEMSFPPDIVRLLPGLSSLAVFYKETRQGMSEQISLRACRLEKWLHHFPKLSKLVVVRGPPVKLYAASIPATVSSLTLCVPGLNPEDLAVVAPQVPNLLHLHVDAWPSHLGSRTADIPQLFPKLKTLALRHQHVPRQDFLSLRRLQDLERLEVLDSHPSLSELVDKLRLLTRYRLCITVSSWLEDVSSCPCVELLS